MLGDGMEVPKILEENEVQPARIRVELENQILQ